MALRSGTNLFSKLYRENGGRQDTGRVAVGNSKNVAATFCGFKALNSEKGVAGALATA